MDGGSCRPRREGLEEVGGCLQMLDLRSERTSHCVDSEEAEILVRTKCSPEFVLRLQHAPGTAG